MPAESSFPVMPRCMTSSPLSSPTTINLPPRATDSIRRPATRRASFLRSPGVTNREVNRADTIVRPTRYGASVRTTVSTSGNSGMFFFVLWRALQLAAPASAGGFVLRHINQNIVPIHLHRKRRELHILVVIVDACPAIVGPLMPRTNHLVAIDIALSYRPARVRTNPLQRAQLTANIANRVRAVAHLSFHHRPRRQRRQRSNLHKCHICFCTTSLSAAIYFLLRRLLMLRLLPIRLRHNRPRCLHRTDPLPRNRAHFLFLIEFGLDLDFSLRHTRLCYIRSRRRPHAKIHRST